MSRLLALWRKSLSVQLLASMLAAVFISQTIALCLSWSQYLDGWRSVARAEIDSRTAAVARLIEAAPPSLRAEVARASSTEFSRFWLSDQRASDLDDWLSEALVRFNVPLAAFLNARTESGGAPPKSGSSPPTALDLAAFKAGASWNAEGADPASVTVGRIEFADRNGIGKILPLRERGTLNVAFYKQFAPSFWTTPLPIALVLTAGLVWLMGLVTLRRIGRPLRELTKAAEMLGRGQAVQALCERGPDDIRRTSEAFNKMQERLHRYVEDRTRMLAAISHDLRTPLTILRLRAELVDDSDLQDRMLATIEEMHAMTEATLSLASQEQDCTKEPTRDIDLSALVESVCGDLADLGHRVMYAGSDRLAYRCRPEGLKRMVRNLAENAVRYAGMARVSLIATTSVVEITVEDEGPGIPEGKFEDVFAPFYRLETSRSRETGGLGLGLSIARTIARQHGGDIVLSARERGLKATIVLPV